MRGLIYLSVILLFAGCTNASRSPLRIAVASNMRYAMDELVAVFEQKYNVQCETMISSSGKLTAQIESGAPFDIFLSADMQYPEYLYKKGLTRGNPLEYAEGTLVLWTGHYQLEDLFEIKREHWKPIALANPKIAPYGKAANDVLLSMENQEFWKTRLVFGESISQVNQFLISGAAKIGFTAKSVIYSDTIFLSTNWIEIPDSLYRPVKQGVVTLNKRATHFDDAEKFAEFLFTEEAQNILIQHGYKTGM